MFIPSGVAAASGAVLNMVAGTTNASDTGYSIPSINDAGTLNPDTFKSFTVVHQITLIGATNFEIRMDPVSIPNTDASWRQLVITEVPDQGFGRIVYLREDATYSADFGGFSRWQYFAVTDFFVDGRTYQCIYS